MPPHKKPDRAKRKQVAIDAITRVVERGSMQPPDIKRILAQEVHTRDLADDYFKVLNKDDHLALHKHLIGLLSAQVPRKQQQGYEVRPEAPLAPSSVQARTNHGWTPTRAVESRVMPPTPPSDDNAAQAGQAHGRTSFDAAGNLASPNITSIVEVSPTYADETQQFDIAMFDPQKRTFLLATACHCQQERSFISLRIIERDNLWHRVDRQDGQSIKFCWQFQNSVNGDTCKTPCTRFWIIQDDKIKHDIAIGTAYLGPDPLALETDSNRDDPFEGDLNANAARNEQAQAHASRDYVHSMTTYQHSSGLDAETYRRLGYLSVGQLEAIEGRPISAVSTSHNGSPIYRSPSRGRSVAQSSTSSRSSNTRSYYNH